MNESTIAPVTTHLSLLLLMNRRSDKERQQWASCMRPTCFPFCPRFFLPHGFNTAAEVVEELDLDIRFTSMSSLC